MRQDQVVPAEETGGRGGNGMSKFIYRYKGDPIDVMDNMGNEVRIIQGDLREVISVTPMAFSSEVEVIVAAYPRDEEDRQYKRAKELMTRWCQPTVELFYADPGSAMSHWEPVEGETA